MAVDDFLYAASAVCTLHAARHANCTRSRDTDAFVLPSKAYYPTSIPIA
jgi:hypothetical protein